MRLYISYAIYIFKYIYNLTASRDIEIKSERNLLMQPMVAKNIFHRMAPIITSGIETIHHKPKLITTADTSSSVCILSFPISSCMIYETDEKCFRSDPQENLPLIYYQDCLSQELSLHLKAENKWQVVNVCRTAPLYYLLRVILHILPLKPLLLTKTFNMQFKNNAVGS